MKEEKIRLLFVCLGNICRSPSAEAVMKKLVKDAGACGSQGIFVGFDLPSGTSVGLP